MKKRKIHSGRLFIVCLCLFVILTCTGYLSWKAIRPLFQNSQAKVADINNQNAQVNSSENESFTGESNTASFTFAGVGDNLLHDVIFVYPQQRGETDFDFIYQLTNPITQNADLAYINAETLMAGESLGLSGYPMFNGPVSFLHSISNSGFDWLSTASNHALDRGYEGICVQKDYIEQNLPALTATGSYRQELEAETPVVREVNGIRVGLATFTYGTNGIPVPSEAPFCVDIYRNNDGSVNYDLLKSRLDTLKEVSDVQIVSMHWGEEYVSEPTEEEREIARFLNEQGVEAVIGTHPHVIQEAEIIHGDNQDTLVYYSLGNFLSAQLDNDKMVGGLAEFTLNFDFDTKEVTFTDVKYSPTITWFNAQLDDYRTATLDTYTAGMAASHYVAVVEGQDMSPEWVRSYFSSVAGSPDGIEIGV